MPELYVKCPECTGKPCPPSRACVELLGCVSGFIEYVPPCTASGEHRWVSEVQPADGDEERQIWWDLANGVGPADGPITTTVDSVFCADCGASAQQEAPKV